MNIISESGDMGANSLTPSCPNDNGNSICNNLTNTLPIYKVAADRLSKQNPGLNLTVDDIANLMGTNSLYSPFHRLLESQILTSVLAFQRPAQWNSMFAATPTGSTSSPWTSGLPMAISQPWTITGAPG